MGTSLWLVPTSNQIVKLKRVMQIKSATAKSPSSYVDFDPHVTLATVPSTTSLSDLQAAIPHKQNALPVSFKSVDVGEKYFMSVYATVHESEGLAKLRSHLRATLGESTVPPIPHLSLYYIDNADRDERLSVAEALKSSGRVVNRVGGVSLNCAESVEQGTEEDLLEGLDGEAVWIVKCEGPVPEWEVLQKIKLARSA